MVKFEVVGVVLDILSVYAHMLNATLKTCRRLWSTIDEVMERLCEEELNMIGAGISGHVGE